MWQPNKTFFQFFLNHQVQVFALFGVFVNDNDMNCWPQQLSNNYPTAKIIDTSAIVSFIDWSIINFFLFFIYSIDLLFYIGSLTLLSLLCSLNHVQNKWEYRRRERKKIIFNIVFWVIYKKKQHIRWSSRK